MAKYFWGLSIDKQKKLINYMTILVIICAFVFLLAVPTALAAEVDKNDMPHTMADYIQTGVAKSIINIYKGTDQFGNVKDEFVKNNMSSISGISTGADAIKGVAGALVVLIALANFFENVQKGQEEMEAVFKVIIEICVAGMFIINLNPIMTKIGEVGDYFVTQFVNDPSKGAATDSTTKQILMVLTGKDCGTFIWWTQAVITLFLPWLATLIMTIAAKFLMLQVFIEIGVRKIFTPIAVADIYREGFRSPGARWLKRYFAVFLKLAMILAVVAIGSHLLNKLDVSSFMGADKTIFDVFEYFINIIAIQFTIVGFMFKTSELANEVVGA